MPIESPAKCTSPVIGTTSDPAQAVKGGAKELILVVEDCKDIRTLLRDTLTADGYRVLEAESGREAIEKYTQTQPAAPLVLLDLNLPDMSGWEIMPVLRDTNAHPKFLIITGSATSEMRRQLIASGGVDVLGKPFCRRDLLGKVRGLLAAPAVQ